MMFLYDSIYLAIPCSVPGSLASMLICVCEILQAAAFAAEAGYPGKRCAISAIHFPEARSSNGADSLPDDRAELVPVAACHEAGYDPVFMVPFMLQVRAIVYFISRPSITLSGWTILSQWISQIVRFLQWV